MLSKESTFSYTCNNCMQCCKYCKVALNPYEVLQLAHCNGISTTDFIQQYVEETTWTLKHKPNGGCVFIDRHSCCVYQARPLPCRLYPIARMSSMNGEEQYSVILPELSAQGVYGDGGTIQQYINQHDVAEYIYFADKYLSFFGRLLRKLYVQAGPSERIRDMVLDHLCVQHQLLSSKTRRAIVAPLLDVDRVVSDYCVQQSLEMPTCIKRKSELHILALDESIHGGEILCEG